MGRWAIFNTGGEYKFAFAIQESSDIQAFAGFDITEEEEDDGRRHMWVRKWNLDSVRALLKTCSDMQVEPTWESYPHTSEGTDALLTDLRKTLPLDSESPMMHRYILGCMIYHQLLYTPVLVAHYEE